ncbi:sensor histidine kinase DcuS [Lachnospiraceae bacterium]|nr:sensor histidine kinase DcuS [Lachnospiraceae bacterium]
MNLMQITNNPTIILYLIITILISLTAIVSLTNMLLYPLSKPQKLFLFFWTFLITLTGFLISKLTFFIFAALFILLGTILLIAIFQKHRIVNLLCSIFNLYISIGTNYILIALLSYFKIDKSFFKEYPYIFCLYLVVQLIYSYFISYLLYKPMSRYYFESKMTGLKTSYGIKIFAFLFCEIGICCFIFLLQVIYNNYIGMQEMIKYNVYIFLILFLTINGISILFLGSLLKEQQLADQLAQTNAMKDYTERLEALYLDLRSFKHDYINILSSLHSYISEKNYEGLENYFNAQILPTGTKIASDDSIYGRLGHIKSPEVKSILYSKIFLAFKQKINVTTQVNEEIDNFPMNTIDLIRVLGILLDNAIDSSAATNEKNLIISIIKDSEGIYIQIKNSSCHIDNIENLYQIGVSSKGSKRGLGLYEARKILEQYSNTLLQTEYANFVFNQKLVLLFGK